MPKRKSRIQNEIESRKSANKITEKLRKGDIFKETKLSMTEGINHKHTKYTLWHTRENKRILEIRQ